MQHSHMAIGSVIAEARLQPRNQLTLPDAMVQSGALFEGDRFVVVFDPAEPDTIRLHKVRASYVASLPDAFGDPQAYLDEVREGWL